MTSTVPPGRGLSASIPDPGTSYLATISLSLRDKSHSPIEAPQNYLSAYASEPGLSAWPRPTMSPRSSRSAFHAPNKTRDCLQVSCVPEKRRGQGQLPLFWTLLVG